MPEEKDREQGEETPDFDEELTKCVRPNDDSKEEEAEAAPLYQWDYRLQCEREQNVSNKQRNRGVWTFAIVMAASFLLCFALLIGVILIGNKRENSTHRESLQTVEIAEIVKPQTVLISVASDTSVGYGTGFFIRENGYIATNYHVVEGAKTIEVTLYSGAVMPASLVGYSVADDLAVIKIDGRFYPTVSIGDSDLLRVGETAIAVGNPMGTSYAWSTTQGIISATERNMVVSGTVATYECKMIQMDTPVNTGNSGGPLCNDSGEVIGIVTRKVEGYDYIGLAIPINGAMELLDAIVETGSADHIESSISRIRPMIGITCRTIERGESYSDGQSIYVSDQNGVLVITVDQNGAAAQTLKIGDIIISLNGQDVHSLEALTDVLYSCKPGQSVPFEAIRKNEKIGGTITFLTE